VRSSSSISVVSSLDIYRNLTPSGLTGFPHRIAYLRTARSLGLNLLSGHAFLYPEPATRR
jgi:hypothetical protein